VLDPLGAGESLPLTEGFEPSPLYGVLAARGSPKTSSASRPNTRGGAIRGPNVFGDTDRVARATAQCMGALPVGLDTDEQPPMTVPLRHFVVGFGFLVAGIVVGAALVLDLAPGVGRLAHVHLLLAGWVCLTIMGAMTQFVPVWSGTSLYSRRLANGALALVAVGLSGFASALLAGSLGPLAGFGAVMVAGFWVFAYNVGRTLLGTTGVDVTEGHFLFALACFVGLALLGLVLAVDLRRPVLSGTPLSHAGVLGAHVTLAVFGAVLTTVYGALYQLATMFTQTELHRVDTWLKRVELVGHPVGVLLLAGGRLTEARGVAVLGGLFLLCGTVAFTLVFGHKLVEATVEWTPMHRRYAVAAPALGLWATLSAPAWLSAPLRRDNLLGAPGATHLLVLGVVGFVVFGTLYHVVPFIVWVHEYSDLLGFEDVPMIDDLYDDRLAMAEFGLLVSGAAALTAHGYTPGGPWLAPTGGVLVPAGVCAFLCNQGLVVYRHASQPFDVLVVGSLSPRVLRGGDQPTDREPAKQTEDGPPN